MPNIEFWDLNDGLIVDRFNNRTFVLQLMFQNCTGTVRTEVRTQTQKLVRKWVRSSQSRQWKIKLRAWIWNWSWKDRVVRKFYVRKSKMKLENMKLEISNWSKRVLNYSIQHWQYYIENFPTSIGSFQDKRKVSNLGLYHVTDPKIPRIIFATLM